MKPLKSIEPLFKRIKREGHFFMTSCGVIDGYFKESFFHFKSLEALNVEFPELISHLNGGVIGLNLKKEKSQMFLNEWLKETQKVIPSLSAFPEELIISVIAWRMNMQSSIETAQIFMDGGTPEELKEKRHFFKHDKSNVPSIDSFFFLYDELIKISPVIISMESIYGAG